VFLLKRHPNKTLELLHAQNVEAIGGIEFLEPFSRCRSWCGTVRLYDISGSQRGANEDDKDFWWYSAV
jgi:hypothetical protein